MVFRNVFSQFFYWKLVLEKTGLQKDKLLTFWEEKSKTVSEGQGLETVGKSEWRLLTVEVRVKLLDGAVSGYIHIIEL